MVLLLMNAGVFVVIGSLLSRLHVLQEWMGISYADFSWVLFSFSCGAVISNLVGGKLIRWQGPKRILSLAMACIVLSLCGFLEKPSYAGLIALWTLFSFGFGTSMIILFSQAGTLQNQQEKGSMSFYQGISGVTVGKTVRFRIEAVDEKEARAVAEDLCATFLANPVIEDAVVTVGPPEEA